MNSERLASRPGVLHEDIGGDVADLADHIKLAKAIETRALIADRIEFSPVIFADFARIGCSQ